MTSILREKMYARSGLVPRDSEPTDYTPVTVSTQGKDYGIDYGKYENVAWFSAFTREPTFNTAEELLTIQPENVTIHDVAYLSDNGYVNVENKRAIVGDNSHKCYSINSPRYQPVQNQAILNGLYNATSNLKVNVFGHTTTDGKGRFNAYAIFANPEYHIRVGDYRDEAFMMIARVFNSHAADSRFGIEIMGVRKVCANLGAYGNLLGRATFRHFATEGDITDCFQEVIGDYPSKIPAFENCIFNATQVVLEDREIQADALAGIGLEPRKVNAILDNRIGLNPEAIGRSMTVYDLYNAATAYVTHKVTKGGARAENTNLEMSEDFAQLLEKADRIDAIIKAGRAKRTLWNENGISTSGAVIA